MPKVHPDAAEFTMSAPRGLTSIPESLRADLARPGYVVDLDGSDLRISRALTMQLASDPDADAMPLDAPFSEDERKRVGALVAIWAEDAAA